MSEADRQLERWLAETAEQLRPRHPGWARLLERLGPQAADADGLDAETVPETDDAATVQDVVARKRTRSRSPWRRFGAALIAAAVLVLCALLLRLVTPRDVAVVDWRERGPLPLWAPLDQPVYAATNIAVERRGIELTIFNPVEMPRPTLFMPLQTAAVDVPPKPTDGRPWASVSRPDLRRQPQPVETQGLALVKDRRMILSLKAGDNLVKFTDVAATIDPTSVRLIDEHDLAAWQVVEQNFEFDLASADAVLKRYVGSEHQVTCIGGEGEVEGEGYLLAFDDDAIVLADALPSDDADVPRPKTATIRRPGLKAVQVAELPDELYVRPTLVWRLRTERPGDHLTLLTYLCGRASWQANYVVVVRQSDPDAGDTIDLQGWVTIDNRSGTTYDDAGLKLIAGDVNRVPDPWAVPETLPSPFFMADDVDYRGRLAVAKEFVERDFFEYKLYELNQTSTIRDAQIKQLGLLEAEGIRARRRYRFNPYIDARHTAVELLITNSEENHLGRPLPKGDVLVTAIDADGDRHVIGRAQIDHTPKDEELELTIGRAFDVVGEFETVRVEQRNPQRRQVTYRFKLRNHQDRAIDVRCVGHLDPGTNWQIIRSDADWTRHDVNTVYFDFRLEANRERTINYTVQYETPAPQPVPRP